MSHCLMYTKGDSVTIRGVKCDFVRVKYTEVEACKAKGYVNSVNELTESEEVNELTESDFVSVINDDPTSLTKDELKYYADKHLDLKLTKNMLEANMIAKIKEVLNEA